MNPNKLFYQFFKFKGIYVILFLLFWAMPFQGFANDIQVIRDRIITELLSPQVDDLEVVTLINTQREDGTWPGINYEDVSRTAFEHRIHTSNMVTLAKAYRTPSSKFGGNKVVIEAIQKALVHWVENDYFCDNWWHNQIGTPTHLVSVMLLVGDEMPEELVSGAQPMIGRAHLNASGARPSGDRIKIAGILAKNLLFLEDFQQFDEVIRVIEGEIKFSTGERGMQHDYSFHHRVDRVNNTLSYGLGYASAFAEWAVYVAGTEYSFSEEKTRHLVDYYLDGISKTMVYGKFPDAGVKNRSVARKGTLKPMGSETPRKLMEITNYRKPELEEIIKIREEGLEHVSLSHSTFYWQSEHFTFQQPHFFTSVRMFSTRNDNMEVPYNSEGLKNHHRGDGTNHLSLTGEEYYDIFPVMDYQKIPGATILQKEALPGENEIQQSGLTDFVGAVTDGLYGAAAFDFRSPYDPLQAKKAWFFFDEEYVALGAGIASQSNQNVVTTLNQNILQGSVTVESGSGTLTVPSGEHKLEAVKWIHSNNVAYLFPQDQQVHLTNEPKTGNWTRISKQSDTPKEDVTKNIFKLWLDHGNRPRDAGYAYVVIPGVGVEQSTEYDLDSTLDILSNTKKVQAVQHHKSSMLQAVFYEAGVLDFGSGLQLTMDGPGLILLHYQGKNIEKITVADPSRKLGKLHFSLNTPIGIEKEGLRSLWNEDLGLSEISIELPKGVYAGKSSSFIKQ